MKKIIPIILVFLAVILYTLTIRGMHGNLRPENIKNNLDQAAKPFELSPERGRYILTVSLAEEKSFGLSLNLAQAADPDVGYNNGNGKFYIYFPPGVSMIAVPFYLIGKQYDMAQVFAFASVTLFAIGNLVFIYFITKNVLKASAGLSFLAAWIFGFASTSWSYAVTLYQHHITTFLILSSFYWIWAARKSKHGIYMWITGIYVWLAYGVGIWLDYPNVFLLFPVMVYFAISNFSVTKKDDAVKISLNPAIIVTSVVFIAVVVLHGYYNQVNFGNWKTLSGSLPGIKYFKNKDGTFAEKMLVSNIAQKNTKNVVNFFREEQLPRSFSILTFAIDKGIFIFSPIFFLALLGIYQFFRKSTLPGAVLIACVVVNLFLYSSWDDPWGGWAYGPRYLIISMSILAMFVAYWLNSIRYVIVPRLLTFLLFFFSSATALLGVLTSNQIPPRIEAVFLKMKYGFFLPWDYLLSNLSGSYVYNTYLANQFTLFEYFTYILIAVNIIAIWLLFSPRHIEKHETHH